METLAIQAGGIRKARIILPIMATAFILSLATAVLHETVILRAEQIWSNDRLDGQDEIEFGRDSFWYHKGATITNVSLADPETRTLQGVEIFERSGNGSVTRVIRADRVRIAKDGVWQIEAATIWNFDAEDETAAPEFEENVSIDLDLTALQGDLLLGADPELLTLPALARYLESNSQTTNSTVRRALDRYHERLSSPWMVLAFAWIAMPFALRIDERGHFAGPAVAAVATLGLYFTFESAGHALAQEALIPVGITPWLAMAFFSLVATVAVAFRAR
jgi:lipopolysaccharide export LptBFGC system permease protein LptF